MQNSTILLPDLQSPQIGNPNDV